MPTVNWNNLRKAADDASRPLPADWYDLIVVKAEATIASTGSPMIKLQLDVADGPHRGRRVFDNLVLSVDSPFAMGIFFRHLDAFGVNPETEAPDGSLEPIANALIGRRIRGKIGIRMYNGSERNDVEEYAPSTGTGVPAPSGPVASAGPTGPAPTATPAPSPTPTPSSTPAPSSDAPNLPY